MKVIKEIIGLLTDIRDELRKFNAPAQPKVQPKPEAEKGGKTPDEIKAILSAQKFGRSSWAKWNEVEQQKVLDGIRKGWSHERIAKTLPGRTSDAVAQYIKRLRRQYSI